MLGSAALGLALGAQAYFYVRGSRPPWATWALHAVCVTLCSLQTSGSAQSTTLRACLWLLLQHHITGWAPVFNVPLSAWAVQYLPLASAGAWALVVALGMPLVPPESEPVSWLSAPEALGAACVALSVVTAVTLWGWSWWVDGQHGEMQDFAEQMLSPAWLAPIALANATTEELEFRVVLQDAVQATTDPLAAVVITNVLFALAHVRGGFPSGASGGVLVFVWGCALSALKLLTGSILPGLCVHVVADVTIFLLVLKQAHSANIYNH
jgi:membrane protease YdiL (CAAX protease family)